MHWYQTFQRGVRRIMWFGCAMAASVTFFLGVASLRAEPIPGAENPMAADPHLWAWFFLPQGAGFTLAAVIGLIVWIRGRRAR